MKKIIISIITFFIAPFLVNAADYDLTDFLIKAEILNNGDMIVNELIVLDGSFNGYERDILYANQMLENGTDFSNNTIYNASDITNITIKGKYVNKVNFDTFDDLDYILFNCEEMISNGEKAKYKETILNYGYRYRMYYYSNNKKVAFNIKYTVKNAVVLHNDVAELYWTFVPNGFEDTIKNVQIKVYLPNVDNSDNFRIWAHGNLNGEINYINKEGMYANIKNIKYEDSVDIRTSFNKDLITDKTSIKRTNVNALERIIEIETERAEAANNLRKELLIKYNLVKYLTIVFYSLVITLGLLIYFKYGKSPKSNYYSKYNREFIDDYNVEVIDYLMNKKITPNAMSASILNLVYKKNISVKETTSVEKVKNKECKFTLENTDNLNESETILIEFLFDKVGKKKLNEESKKEFTTIDLKKYAKGTKTCDKFISSYNTWKDNVISIGKQQKFYESSGIPSLIGVLIVLFGFFITALTMTYEVDFIPSYLVLFVAFPFLYYSIKVTKRTLKGAEHYDKWKAFKNFLDDFGSFELKELPEIILWERYLVYATIFGLADKVEKVMNVKIKEINVENLNYEYYPSYFYIDLGSTINSSISSAINNAYSTQAANYANSHSSSSSGSGFGGGFSSGGGFGGGGGGGRGF